MLDSIRCFLLVVEHGTFTEAARRAHKTQPALSASIQKLEQQLGRRLFVRGRHGAELTAEGHAYLAHARAAVNELEEGRKRIEELAGLRTGEVRIGAGSTACTYMLPAYFARFREKHPGIRFRLVEAVTDVVSEAIREGELDLGVVTAQEGERWRNDELVLVAAPGIDPSRAPFLTFRRGATTRTLLDRHFPEADVAMELGSIGAIKESLVIGLGVALLSRLAVVGEVERGELVIVPDRRTPVKRPLRLVHRGTAQLSPAAAAFRAALLADRTLVTSFPLSPRARAPLSRGRGSGRLDG